MRLLNEYADLWPARLLPASKEASFVRSELLYNPRLLCERLAEFSLEKRRLGHLRKTPAENLRSDHIDSLELLELLKERSPQVIYDIGANIGTWTLLAKAIFPNAQIHAFEPLPTHAAHYLSQLSHLPGVHLHEIALGNEQGAKELRVVDFSDASSVLPLTPQGESQWQVSETDVVSVKIDRLDSFAKSAGIPAPDLIKLDVQGFELEVLKGASEVLRTASAVLTEVSFQEFYRGQCLFEDLVTFLAGHDFRVLALGHGTALGRPLVQADVLFVKRV